MAESAETESELSGDLWGGFAAALVALPSAIAFGVAIYAPLGAERGAAGAVAGVLGAVALGLVAPALGGAPRLITAPCGPAAAVMSALAADLAARGLAPEYAISSMVAVAALAGVLQLGFGLLGAGRLIKYIPYPVVSGYLSGVAILLFLKQLPGLLGLRAGTTLGHALTTPSTWSGPSVLVGVVTIAAMAGAPFVTRRVPPPVIGLVGGLGAYFGLAARDASLLTTVGNPLVVGPIGGGGGSLFAELPARLLALPSIPGAVVGDLVAAAATLSVLLSMDTLKTCVVVDALTRSRHDSNRELRGQGAANLASALLGGVPGAGTMGATLVSVTSGGRTRRAGLVAGATSLVAYVALSQLLAWIPLAALAGILLVVAFRMFDRASLKLLRSRTTLLDFLVVLAVVVVAVGVGLVTAAGVGIALATVLFVREQIRGTVVRRRASGEQIQSKQQRLPQELAVLAEHGGDLTVVWLSGDLFFGTTDQLFTELAGDLSERRYVVLELSRVQSLDYTAAHLLEQMEDQLGSHGGHLLYAGLRRGSPAGRELIRYLDEMELGKRRGALRFDELDAALEWVEDEILAEERHSRLPVHHPLELGEIDLLAGLDAGAIAAVAAAVATRHYEEGEQVFAAGQPADELLLVRRGRVRVFLPLAGGDQLHLATFGQGDSLGEIAFLERSTRTARAVALEPTELFVLSRHRFDEVSRGDPAAGAQIFARLARVLAARLRRTDAEVRALQDA